MTCEIPGHTFAEIYRRHRAQALAIARRILKDPDDAEDVVQDVFIRLCVTPVRFDGKAAYSTWLHRVMVNSAINQLRSKKRRAKLRGELETPLTPEQEAVGRELAEQFAAALREIDNERQKQVLFLREVRGFSYPEIAQLLRIPEGTVKSTLNRGRAQVMAKLGVTPLPSGEGRGEGA